MITFIEKHFNKHECKPDFNKDRPLLYMMQFCPFSRRVTLTMMFHGIIHERIFIDITCKPFWYFDVSKDGKVPVLEVDGEFLSDSEMICRYLDKINPQKSLFKKEKEEGLTKAKVWFEKIIKFHKTLAWEHEMKDEHKKGYLSAMKDFKDLPGETFINSKTVGIADFVVYPIVEMIPLCYQRLGLSSPLELPGCSNDRLIHWWEAMQDLDAVRAETISPELHTLYIKRYLNLDHHDF